MIKSSCVDKGLLKAYIVGFIYEETSTFWKQLHDSGSDLSCSAYSSRFKRQNLDLKRFQISNLLPVYIRLMFFPKDARKFEVYYLKIDKPIQTSYIRNFLIALL